MTRKPASRRRDYARGTYAVQTFPFGLYVTGAALCTDGKVRKLKRIAETADTFFSVPASVTVAGRTVAGFVSLEETDAGQVLAFHAYKNRKNADALPETRADS